MSEQAKEIEIKLSEDSDEEEPDTGKSDGDFPLWATQEALSGAKDWMGDLMKSQESLAKTAATLIGWSVPSSAALIGVLCGPHDHITLTMKWMAGGALACTTAAAYIAFWGAIRTRTWQSCGIHPKHWEKLLDAPLGEHTELDTSRELLTVLGGGIDANREQLTQMSKAVGHASFLFMIAPAAAIGLGAIYQVASYLVPHE